MKLAIIGAGGLRTPLIIKELMQRNNNIPIDQLALMDIRSDHLDYVRDISIHGFGEMPWQTIWTTDQKKALDHADFVITTFRVGFIEARVIDERIAIEHGVIGQETTGAGGFAMGMRSIPILLDYVRLMEDVCPDAWLINFANPAGMMTEAIFHQTGWQKAVGICDGPIQISLAAAEMLNADPNDIFLEYFGLNHLGWARKILLNGVDILPDFLASLHGEGKMPYLPFSIPFVKHLGLIPNEYLNYYYNSRVAFDHQRSAGALRGESILKANNRLYQDLIMLIQQNLPNELLARYQAYMDERHETYKSHADLNDNIVREDTNAGGKDGGGGYAGVALDLIEALLGMRSQDMILNVPNQGAIPAMDQADVVEVTAHVDSNGIHPYSIGMIPPECLGLMKTIKSYERLTIGACTNGSLSAAQRALTIHPLVGDEKLASSLIKHYRSEHAIYFPELT